VSWQNLAEKVNDEKDFEADMVGVEKGLKERPKRPRVVIPGRPSHQISATTGQELRAA